MNFNLESKKIIFGLMRFQILCFNRRADQGSIDRESVHFNPSGHFCSFFHDDGVDKAAETLDFNSASLAFL